LAKKLGYGEMLRVLKKDRETWT